MSVKIAITNEKGGVGKTTTAVNVAAILAVRSYKVLLIDADPQSYATRYYDLYDPQGGSLYEVLAGADPQEAIRSTAFGVDVLRSKSALKNAEAMLDRHRQNGGRSSDLLLQAMKSVNEYDFVIIDCPPQDSDLLDNVHSYADYLVIPMIPDEFALDSLQSKMENFLRVRQTINPRLRVLGGLITMHEKNAVREQYRNALQSQKVIPFFHTVIRKNITLSHAINASEPINVYDKNSRGNQDYQALVDEILGRVAK